MGGYAVNAERLEPRQYFFQRRVVVSIQLLGGKIEEAICRERA